jgi:ATP synthase protein I
VYKSGTGQIRRGIYIQFMVSVVLALVLLAVAKNYALSALAGGLTASLAQVWFAWRVFSLQQETEPNQILGTVYRAEIGKISLTITLFIVAIVLIRPLNMVALMGSYLLVTLIPWLSSFFLRDDSLTWRSKNVR